ncbi:MAG: cation-transporting ATPase [Armatimonadetes bacterium]|nr:cation-transporting ATPase [Armatimonadota bacterium]
MHQPVVGDEKEYPFAEKDGVKYIFCCQSCPGMFKKDPSKYAIAKN